MRVSQAELDALEQLLEAKVARIQDPGYRLFAEAGLLGAFPKQTERESFIDEYIGLIHEVCEREGQTPVTPYAYGMLLLSINDPEYGFPLLARAFECSEGHGLGAGLGWGTKVAALAAARFPPSKLRDKYLKRFLDLAEQASDPDDKLITILARRRLEHQEVGDVLTDAVLEPRERNSP